jgi:YgiT-type zinc finger domain-containing protein
MPSLGDENPMFDCHVCHSTQSTIQTTNEVFQINGKFYLVENIPVEVCNHCGEESFSRETTENIRKMLQESSTPIKTIPMDVFSYDSLPV